MGWNCVKLLCDKFNVLSDVGNRVSDGILEMLLFDKISVMRFVVRYDRFRGIFRIWFVDKLSF